jgi:hypothetical protein
MAPVIRAALALVAVVSLTLLGSAAAAAEPDPRREKERLTAADMALAGRIALRRSDLSGPWQAYPIPRSDGERLTCPGFNPDLSAFTITGKATAAFADPRGSSAVAAVEVYRTRADAIGDFRAGAKPAVAGCLRHVIEQQFRAAGDAFTLRVVSARMVRAPRVGERAIAYRIVASVEAGGAAVRVYLDVLGFQRGRSIVALFFTGAHRPVPGQVRVAQAVAARMR